MEKMGSNEFQQSQSFVRNAKDRHNPFAACKADKFIEFYQQNKNNEDQLGLKIMRHFGVGAENTPLGPLLKKEEKREEIKTKKQPLGSLTNNLRSTWSGKKFASSVSFLLSQFK